MRISASVCYSSRYFRSLLMRKWLKKKNPLAQRYVVENKRSTGFLARKNRLRFVTEISLVYFSYTKRGLSNPIIFCTSGTSSLAEKYISNEVISSFKRCNFSSCIPSNSSIFPFSDSKHYFIKVKLSISRRRETDSAQNQTSIYTANFMLLHCDLFPDPDVEFVWEPLCSTNDIFSYTVRMVTNYIYFDWL